MAGGNERGFLGDHALEMTPPSAAPIAAALDRVAMQTYRTQVVKDALTFQGNISSYVAEIYANNIGDPNGYARDIDALAGTLMHNLGVTKKQYSAMAEGSKREYVLKIARDLDRENTAASKELINGLQRMAIEELEVPSSLLVDSDQEVRTIGASGVERVLEKALNAMAARNGEGSRLLSPAEITSFEDRFNNKIKRAMVMSLLKQCDTEEAVDALINRLADGEIEAPRYGITAGAGENLGSFYAGMGSIDMGDDPRWAEEMGRKFLTAKGAIARRAVRSRELALLDDTGIAGQLKGVTQSSIDEWFDSRYRDRIVGAHASTGEDIIRQLAERVDRMPRQVVAIIHGAVSSGDNDAIQAAAPYVRVWQERNPAALGKAFKDDEGTLVRMFALANGISTASTTQVGVRDRTLKSFSNRGISEDKMAHYDELVSAFASEDIITDMLNLWKNNGAARRDRVINMYGPREEQSNEELSPFFVTAMEEKFRNYLEYSGGDSSAATKMMQVYLSQLGEMKIQSGILRRGTLMSHCPENYPGVQEHSREIMNAMDSIGTEEFQRVVSAGLLPDGARYIGSTLLADEVTEWMDGELSRNSQAGIDHMRDSYGNITRCPSYMHVVDYEYGSVLYRLSIGRYIPLVEGKNNGK